MSDPSSTSALDDAPTDQREVNRLEPYEAVLLVSFGGPERPEEVVPFLENVTRGRGIPRERLAEVGEHYFLFGGKSPINDQCRTLLAALRSELDGARSDPAALLGQPQLGPVPRRRDAPIEAAGHRRVLAVMTSAYPSYSSCRQYRENLYDATRELDLEVDRIRHYADHPGFVAASVDATVAGARPARRQAAQAPAGLRHPLDPDVDGRLGRAGAAQRRRRVRRTGIARSPPRSPGRSRPGAAPSIPGSSSTARGPGRRASRGWSPTSTTASPSSPRQASTPWCWCRSASSPTTWR